MSAGKEHECLTPTEALVTALETAEEMESVVIVYRLKDPGKHGVKGYGWITLKDQDPVEIIGLLATAKGGVYKNAFGNEDDD